jgi:uncharacterized protein YecT (DUF1311 family)
MQTAIWYVVLVLLFSAVVTPSAHAGECKASSVPPPGMDCSHPDADQIDYNCPPLWDEVEDCKLNRAYQKLLAALENDPEETEKLRKSQRAWIQSRDADVKLEVEHYGEGGSLGNSIASMRRFKLTRSRLKYIESRLAEAGRW